MQNSSPSMPRPRGARKRSITEKGRAGEIPPVTHGYFKSFDGTKIFYSIEGSGKPMIFCYGLICSSLHWTYQIEHFQRSHKAVWFDYRGHHNSEAPKDLRTLTLENSARDLGLLMDELGLEDAVLLGHSMGVNVVLEFYRQQPHRVAGMVLANGTAKRPLETMFHTNIFQASFKALKYAHDRAPGLVSLLWKTQKKNPLVKSFVSLGGFNPHLTPKEDIELYVQQVANTDPQILLSLVENYDSYDATAWLHTIGIPTLIIAGQHDNIIPVEQQELMKQLIPNSRLEVIRHGSHCPQMDLPELVNHKIEDFLGELGYASRALQEPKSSPSTENASRSTETHRSPAR